MALKIISADERLAARAKTNAIILGPSGVGKTTLARTLPPETTLFIDMEAGTLAVQDWPGDVIDVRKQAAEMNVHPWEFLRALVCWLGGPDPAASNNPADQSFAYSASAYATYCQAFGDPSGMSKYTLNFWDSITVASRHSFQWSQRQPEAFSEKTGKPDTRGAYGLHGREMVAWFTQIQHMQNKSNVIVGILDRKEDDLKRVTWEPQIVGGMAGNALPGIFDQVMTLQIFSTAEGEKYRALVCTPNDFGYPAKDRSGRLDTLEPADLGALINKMTVAPRRDAQLATALPAPVEEAASGIVAQPTTTQAA